MNISRRDFLAGGAAAIGGVALGIPVARAQERQAQRLILVFARGGWDPLVALDPKDGADGVDVPAGRVFRRGGIDLYDAEGSEGVVPAYFERHGDVTAVVRGLTVASVAHEACTRRILTGTPSSASPDMGAIAAVTGGGELPLPYMVLGASAYSGRFSAQSGRVGSSNQLVSVLSHERSFPDTSGQRVAFEPTEEEAGAVREFLKARVERLKGGLGRHGDNARRLDDYLSSIDSGHQLRSFSGVFGDVQDAVAFTQQVDTALDMLEQEVAWTVSLDTGVFWDTHTDSHTDQIANNVILWNGLSRLLDGLKARSGARGGRLIDETKVVVISEMGRTPALNADSGKDHWQVTSALVIGSDVPGERSYGKSTDTGDERGALQSEPIDFGTGQPSDVGRDLEAANFVAGVLAWTGADNERFLPGKTPFMPWVG